MCEPKLLGDSQTFIGVLATIVLLCVVTESSNFLFVILEGYAKPTRKNIKALKKKIDRRLSNLKESIENNTLFTIVNEIDKDKHSSSFLKEKAIEYQTYISFSLDGIYSELDSSYINPFWRRCQDVKYSKEQTFAPLFVLGYCIIVFLCDELVSCSPSLLSLIVSILAIFTFLATLYLSGIWGKFICEFFPRFNEVKHYSMEESRNVSFEKSVTTLVETALIPYLFVILSLWFTDRFITPVSTYTVRLIIGFCILIPLSIIGIRHLRLRRSYGRYSHSQLFWHFVFVLVVSSVYALILFLPYDFLTSSRFEYSQKLWELKFSIIFFIILFGIILPFVIPYFCYNSIHYHSYKEYNKNVKKLDEESRRVEIMIDEYIVDLREWKEYEKQFFDYESFIGSDCDSGSIDIK